ncbi:sensor histidine kinase [Actinomyces wuliandei]|uniref:sensor histidine kinase n=1 Tax=Actinomyces wuliandei TaxID=2057743 RepID=UPI0013E30A68|nr:histidine kinase [Actinomyces wuliandei]
MARTTPHGVCALVTACLAVAGVVTTGPATGSEHYAPLVLLALPAALVWAAAVRSRDRSRFYRRLREQAVAQATHRERLRLAEHLHGLVSHRLAAITLQASTEPMLDEATARRALRDIEDNGRAATADMRDLLTALRSPCTESLASPPRSAPALPEVLTWARSTSLEVTVTGATADIVPVHTPEAGETIAAVVQEALANVARHAGGARVHVQLGRGEDCVWTVVDNDAPAPDHQAVPGAGTGLEALQGRCAALGGRLTASPTADGFRVEARLPDLQPPGTPLPVSGLPSPQPEQPIP